jgi:hypothetical protein
MVLDEPKNGDAVFKINGVTYLMNQNFFDRVKPMAVDYITSPGGSAFSISSVAYNFSLRVLI